jgi:hypothetical protein
MVLFFILVFHNAMLLSPLICLRKNNAPLQPDETTAYSPGLKLKMIKWLQNSERAPSVQVKSFKEGSLAQGNN